jgi:hypothetical protein
MVESKNVIPILAWPGPPAEQSSVERFREMKGAGFTCTFYWFPGNDAMEKALDAANEAGVTLFVLTPELKSDPESTVRRFMKHPALAGWHLTDEPPASDFPMLAEWTKRILAVDPKHHVYINLYPNAASTEQLGTETYQEHVDRFVDGVPVQVISFDHYPMLKSGLRAEWYDNLEVIAAAARRVRKPTWAFTLMTPHGGWYADPTIGNLRLQAFSDLAYGAQGIQHFTYWVPPRDTRNNLDFEVAPIDREGNRTYVYGLAKQLNAEIQNLAPVFLGSKVLHVGHTGELPRGTQAFKPARPIESLTTSSGAVVSRLLRKERKFLVVVNRDAEKAMALDVRFTDGVKMSWQDHRGEPAAVEASRYGGEVEPGGLRVFSWKE